ncbi:hypothetical protein NQZ68_033276 [Dissostichus eleginoides]|nr:hypothetical protein NQZ68_033276 [Dissostichus eleginoides]
MHRPPLSKERTGGDHFGERNLWRVEKTNISPPSKHQPQGDTFEESTFHHTPQFVTKTREFSTYPSSETLNTQKALRRPIFRSVWLHSRSVLPEDQITDQKTVLCCTSCLLESECPLVSERLHTQHDLVIFFVGVVITGSQE